MEIHRSLSILIKLLSNLETLDVNKELKASPIEDESSCAIVKIESKNPDTYINIYTEYGGAQAICLSKTQGHLNSITYIGDDDKFAADIYEEIANPSYQ